MSRIMRATVLLWAAVGAPPAAVAADFTGFYAGVHAGVALDRGGSSVPVPLGSENQAGDRSGLPPSAADAVRLMQRDRIAAPRPGARWPTR